MQLISTLLLLEVCILFANEVHAHNAFDLAILLMTVDVCHHLNFLMFASPLSPLSLLPLPVTTCVSSLSSPPTTMSFSCHNIPIKIGSHLNLSAEHSG